MKLSDLHTPCLVLDQLKLKHNIDVMNARIQAHGVMFRPHVKTAKCLEIARLVSAGNTGPITVSTLREAEYFFAGGFEDILYAVSIVPARLRRVQALMDRGCDLKLILDNIDVARRLAAAGMEMQMTFKTLIEVDCDGHRAGLAPNDPAVVELAKILNDLSGVEFLGFMTHAGESYTCSSIGELKRHAVQEAKAIIDCTQAVGKAGLSARIRSVGSTPTATFVDDLSGISEVRAGVYVFQDLFQVGLGVCGLQDIAMAVLTTVVSHKQSQNRLIVDAGGLALSKDHSTATQKMDCRYGLVCHAESGELIDGLYVEAANQEHGMITAVAGQIDYSLFPIGTQLRILPNHACMTAAAHDKYHVLDVDANVCATWSRCNGW